MSRADEADEIARKVARFCARSCPPDAVRSDAFWTRVAPLSAEWVGLLARYERGECERAEVEASANDTVRVWREIANEYRAAA